MEDICAEMNSQNCQTDQLRTQIKLSFTSNWDSAVWGVGTESIHLENAGGLVYLFRGAKMEVTNDENDFCLNEVPVQIRRGKKRCYSFWIWSQSNFSKIQVDWVKLFNPILMRFLNQTWITISKKIKRDQVGRVSIYTKTTWEVRTHELISWKMTGIVHNGGTLEK